MDLTGSQLLLMLMLLQFETCSSQLRGYNEMTMGDGSSLYIAGKNTLYHYNRTDMEEIANISIGPYNNSDVTVSLMKFVSRTSAMEDILMFCSSLDFKCYSLRAQQINDVIENRTKILSSRANILYIEQFNGADIWYVACPHQSEYLALEGGFCSEPGIYDLTAGLYDERLRVKFKKAGLVDNVQTKEYVAGFSFNDSRIFFSIQGFYDQSSHVTHVCQTPSQKMVWSYIDMPILCSGNNILTDVKEMSNFYIASFTNQQRNGSTVCIYNRSEIKERFADNMKKCYRSEYRYSDNSTWDYIKGLNRCNIRNTTKDYHANLGFLLNKTTHEVLCDGYDRFSGVIGDIPLTAPTVLHYSDQVIKAVTLTERDGIVIAFFGSDHLLNKAVIYPTNNTAKKLNTTYSIGDRLHKQLLNDGTSVYALTPSKILKFPMSNCSTKSTCHDCLTDQDPDCGWCILGNRCTSSSQCKNFQIWLHANNTPASSCPMISKIIPDVIIDVKRSLPNITLHINRDIDFTKIGLYCKFTPGGNSVSSFSKITRANPDEDEKDQITCDHPYRDLENNMDPLRGTMEVAVSLFLNTSRNPLMTSEITYFKCDNFRRCMDCVNTKWSCNWCPYESRCKDSGKGCAQNKTINVLLQCPTSGNFAFNDDLADVNGTLTVSKAEYGVTIRGNNFLEPKADTAYSCEAKFTGPVTFTAVYLNTTAVRCWLNLTSQSMQTGTFSTDLVLKFGRSYVDGNSQPVLFYDCEKMITPRDNCGECESFKYYKPHFQCHWCDGRCLHKTGQCHSSAATQCPQPTIQKVWPDSAFVNSTTLIDIQGYNLGSHFNETINSVTIVRLPCVSQEEGYNPSKRSFPELNVLNPSYTVNDLLSVNMTRLLAYTAQDRVNTSMISCLVGPSNRPRTGSVDITLQGGLTSTFRIKQFSFMIPQVLSICPQFGPKSGGTRLYVKGTNLTIGRSQKVFVAGQLCNKTSCTNTTCSQNRSETTLCCYTGSANASMVNKLHSIHLEFEGQPLLVKQLNYEYVPDPVIMSISPRKSFAAGGRNLTVTGTNLGAIQEPKIYLKMADNRRVSESFNCSRTKISNSSDVQRIFCPSPTPRIKTFRRRGRREDRRRRQPVYTILAFEMDDVIEVGNLSSDIANMTYYPNPTITQFEKVEVYQKFLIIEGSDLNVAATREDVTVWIGSEMKCNVSSFESDKIYCSPPYIAVSQTFPVKVRIGYFEKDVGFIKYEKAEDISYTKIIIGVAVGVIVLGTVIGIVIVIARKKYKNLNSEKKNLEFMMERKEAKFRDQCRKEFAALQTAMSDLTGDLSGGNVLFRDYSVYATYVLFTIDRDHPVMKPRQVMTDSSEQAMDSLKNLLRNTQFLLVLIRTLDKEKSFTIQDKSIVASILIALNHDNMEYITEILKTLLKDLVDKNVAAHTEKLLLRRSECVAEKLLTHWLSICLYHYLKERSGSHLFILYKAIKIQAERGPVDYISNCAKFTLSEDKLLAEDINPKPLELEVAHLDYLDNKEKTITVTVLECDTITQAKSKMLEIFYKNVGYSQRPSVHSTHIEWQQEDMKSRTLSDEDAGSIKDGIWKRINTLEYYGVPSGSKMNLAHSRKDELQNLLPGAGNPDSYIGSVKRAKAVVRTLSGSNFWHLTKQHQEDSDEVKIASDILLPRLLVTKGTLQSYVDDLIGEILCTTEDPPIIIKYLFDFLDTAAEEHKITDPEVLHTWKCNSLLLRFWVNIMKNPEFVFDIHKPQNVDKCLSVVAQAFMDSCSTADVNLGTGSPSNKLLFAKDIPRYKTLVRDYFQHVKEKPAVSDQELNSFLTEKVSMKFSENLYQTSALMEMYRYVSRHRDAILNELDNLEAGSPGQYSPSASKLRRVYIMMDKEDGKIN